MNVFLTYAKKLHDLKKVNDYDIKRNQIWNTFMHKKNEKLPNQGWKIHLSISVMESLKLITEVIPYLIKTQATFKVPSSIKALLSINKGEIGDTQVGKAVTIYPIDMHDLTTIVKDLDTIITFDSGPWIPSDIRYKYNSPIFFRFGNFENNQFDIIENGTTQPYLIDNLGKKVAEVRSNDGTQVDWAPKLPFNNLITENIRVQKINAYNKEFIPIALIYKSLNCDITVGLLKSNGKTAIQKRVFVKIGETVDGLDTTYNLENEYNVLQKIKNKINCPIPIVFERSENYAVIYESYLNGIDLMKIENVNFRVLFDKLYLQIYKLHKLGYVHNDIKPTNVIFVKNKVFLIDFEHARPLGEKKMRYTGTYGYMFNKKLGIEHVAYDNYAFIILLANKIFKIENSQLRLNLNQIMKLAGLYGYNNFIKLITNFRKSNFDHPLNIKPDILHSFCKDNENIIPFSKLKNWFSIACISQIHLAQKEFISKKSYGFWTSSSNIAAKSFGNYGINTGNSGTVIGLITIVNNLKIKTIDNEIRQCLNYLIGSPANLPLGLFCGKAGIAYALLLGGEYLKDDKLIQKSIEILISFPLARNKKLSSDFFNGYASILFVFCKVYQKTKSDLIKNLAQDYFNAIIKSYKEEIGFISDEGALTGAAHGSSGISAVILLYSKIFSDKIAEDFAVKILKSIHSKALEHNLTTIHHDNQKSRSEAPKLGWCHGVEGYLWALIYNLEYINKFDAEIERCVNIIKDEKLINNPSICHGMSGSLDLWIRLKKISKYKVLAEKKIDEITNIIKITSIKRKGHNTWYSDQPGITSFDLWIGSIGPSVVISKIIYE